MVTQWVFLTFPPFSCGKMGKIIVPDGKKNQNRTLFFPIWNIFFPIFPSATLQRNNEIPNQSNLLGLRNGILLPKLFWPTVRKNCSSDREKLLKFEAEGREFANFLRSIYSNSERSEQCLVTECFFNLFLEDLETCRKS